jgi:ABC-type transport system involved in multi-copper enzyme maturation permease subunit
MNAVVWSQLRGMVIYEFKMHWRRRALLIVTLAITVMLLFTMVILGDILRESNSVDPELARRAISATIVFSTWAPIGVSLALILPIMVADTIPLDTQYRVRNTLDSLPLSRPVYVAGKLLGVWAAVLAGMFAIMVASGVGWWLLGGPYDVVVYVQMWVVGVAWIAILNSGLGVLIGAGQPNRRRAILVVIFFLVLVVSVFSRSMQGDDFMGIISPMRGAILSYYLFHRR